MSVRVVFPLADVSHRLEVKMGLPEQIKVGPRQRVRWRGLTASEETSIVNRWRRRRMTRHLAHKDFVALARTVEHAVIAKVMQGKLHIITPED